MLGIATFHRSLVTAAASVKNRKKRVAGVCSAITRKIGRLIPFRVSANGNGQPHAAQDPPLRRELFSVEQLEQHAVKFASSHELASGRAPDKLISRLDENHRILVETYIC